MAETTTVVLSEMEIDAVIRALENSGANSADFKTMIEYFRDPDLAKAGKRVLGRLRGSAQKRTARDRVSGSTDVQREMIPPAVLDEMRAQVAKASADARFAEERRLELRQGISDALEHFDEQRAEDGLRVLRRCTRSRIRRRDRRLRLRPTDAPANNDMRLRASLSNDLRPGGAVRRAITARTN